ncbi:MAG: heat-inducible transcriptional repressor HrcA [Bacillota bacterium]
MGLDERKMKLLKAIVDDYIHTATPVASRALSKRHDFGLSSATIRNEMSDLEEMGYLEQRHTSAGRIPSEKAYRLYVDSLMSLPRLSGKEISMMRSYFQERMDEIEDVILQTARALSSMTDYTAVVLAPQYQKITVRHVQLVPVGVGKALLVVVTDAGVVKDALLQVPEDFDAYDLERISRQLTEWFSNKTTSVIQDIFVSIVQDEMSRHRSMFEKIMETIDISLRPSEQKDVVVGGANNIFNYPEYKNPEKVKSFLSALEHKDILYKMLSEATKVELSISIGAENPFDDVRDCSIVTATYRVGNTTYGSMGLIGPTRMNYARAVAVLNHVGKSLSEILKNINQGE